MLSPRSETSTLPILTDIGPERSLGPDPLAILRSDGLTSQSGANCGGPLFHRLGHGVRGRLGDSGASIQDGIRVGLRPHKFKSNTQLLRVQRVLGILKGLPPKSLLGVGSDAFLWPLLDAFPDLSVSAVVLTCAPPGRRFRSPPAERSCLGSREGQPLGLRRVRHGCQR
jgi:hypothetical protein